jgi:tetratricopeptide (TPR) repeat protein
MPKSIEAEINDLLNQATLSYNKKDYEAALNLLLPLLAVDPNNAELHLLTSKCQTRGNDLEAALTSINRCIELGLEDAEVVNQKGVIYLDQGKMVLAEQYLLESAAMDPSFLEVMTNLMSLYLQIRNSHELKRWGSKVITFTADQIRQQLANPTPDIGELFDAYISRSMARFYMEDVPDYVVLKDIQKAIGYYKQLPPTDQDEVDLDWLLQHEQELLK